MLVPEIQYKYLHHAHKSIEADKMKAEKDEEEIFEWLTVEIILINDSLES